MAFDLATASPVKSGGFDLSTARPMSGEGMPAPRQQSGSFLGDLGASAANLADVTIGGIIPGIAGPVSYATSRAMGLSPEQATKTQERVVAPIEKPFGKAFGVTESPAYKTAGSQQVMDFIGKNIGKGAEWISAQTGLPVADVENMIGTSTLALPAAYRGTKNALNAAAPVVKNALAAAGETPLAQTVIKPMKERAAQAAEERSAQSWQNATKIEAAQKANEMGIALNPAESNPTKMNKAKSVVAGAKDINVKLNEANAPKWTQLAAKDMGLPENTVLNAKAFNEALDKHSAPYETVRKIPVLNPDENVVRGIQDLRIDRPSIGGEASANAVNSLVDEAVTKVTEGRSGAEIVNDIRKLRRDANAIYSTQEKSGIPDPSRIAHADASISIANQLEQLIESNVSDPKLLGEIRKARSAQAKIYDYERATDAATHKLDPQKLAKMLSDGKPLSGAAADMATVAANFPSVATVKAGTASPLPRITRSGVGGSLGFAAGSLVGAPFAGAVLGAGAGGLTSAIAAKRMLSPSYQAAHAVPQDFRIPVNKLAPEVAPTPNLPVPYDFRNALVQPEPSGPNWTYGRSQPEINVGEPTIVRHFREGTQQRPIPKLAAPSAESTMQGVQQRRQYDYELQKHLEEQAAQQAGNVPRASTGAGTLFDLDPITGRLRSVEPSTTPTTLKLSALESAAQKLSGRVIEDETSKSFRVKTGKVDEQNAPTHTVRTKKTGSTFRYGETQAFDMTAEERIAWNKARQDLITVDAGLTKLSDKAVAEKMLDRVWVTDAINKAKAKAAAFDEIAKRAENAQAIREANVNREKMLELMESLEASLRAPRPVSSGAQGPKTREAFKNNMIEQSNIKNNLGR